VIEPDPIIVEEPLLRELISEINTTPKVDISDWVVDMSLKVQISDIYHNPLGSFNSLKSAAEALLTNHLKLSRYAKLIDSVYVDYLGIEANVKVNGFTKGGHVIHPSSKVYPSLEHDLLLPAGRICVITPDLKTVYGVYISVWAAVFACQVADYRRIARYVGMSKLIKTSLGFFILPLTQIHYSLWKLALLLEVNQFLLST